MRATHTNAGSGHVPSAAVRRWWVAGVVVGGMAVGLLALIDPLLALVAVALVLLTVAVLAKPDLAVYAVIFH